MARKKTNSQKARERRESENPVKPAAPQQSSGGSTSTQSMKPASNNLESKKKWTVLAIVGIGLLFFAGLLVVERFLRDDDDATQTPDAGIVTSPVASSGIVRDSELSARCWPNGGPVPGNERDAANPPSLALDPNVTYTATVTTNYGSFQMEFFPDEAPNTVNNFICLANEGFYDQTLFHRVVAGFMIQGGDPLGAGTGGPGYRFPDEPVTRDYVPGIVAMANSGPDTNGSQFFVMVGQSAMPKNYTVFGNVISGLETVQTISTVEVLPNPGNPSEMSSPVEPVQLISVEITTTPKS